MQFRSDPEFEEARINDLEDLVLQLQDRIEKLELCVRYPLQEVAVTPGEIKEIDPGYVVQKEDDGKALYVKCGPFTKSKNPDGQNIAKAIKAME